MEEKKKEKYNNQEALERNQIQNLSRERQREITKKGNKRGTEIKRQNKTFKELLNKFLMQDTTSEELQKEMKKAGMGELTNKNAMTLSLFKQAIAGNVKAIEVTRDTIGEKPSEQIQAEINSNNAVANLTTDELRKIINQNDK